eukprot:GEMP01075083.1.p1 GENE.GEMP01075083.1~~GEMP01075083.1.p1  ORF type:complete len:105 (-),score=4.63 GEMP01075083.1:501-815(-)
MRNGMMSLYQQNKCHPKNAFQYDYLRVYGKQKKCTIQCIITSVPSQGEGNDVQTDPPQLTPSPPKAGARHPDRPDPPNRPRPTLIDFEHMWKMRSPVLNTAILN